MEAGWARGAVRHTVLQRLRHSSLTAIRGGLVYMHLSSKPGRFAYGCRQAVTHSPGYQLCPARRRRELAARVVTQLRVILGVCTGG